MQIASITDT